MPLAAACTSVPITKSTHFHSNIYTNIESNCHRDSHANFDGHANCDSDANCHSHRFRQSDTDTETNPHSEIPCDTEAAPESAAKAVGRPNNWEHTSRVLVSASRRKDLSMNFAI